MAKENIELLREAIKADRELNGKMNAALKAVPPEKRVEKLVEFAEESGFPFLAEEFREYLLRGQEISDEELDAVSGGVDRDWLTDGCSATVEPGSWCWSDDFCYAFDTTYLHDPVMKCPKCGGMMYYDHDEGNGSFMAKCQSCGYMQYCID